MHTRHHMAIDRQRESWVAVAEALAHHLGVFACREHERRHRMPEAMERNPRDAVLVEQTIERLPNPARGKGKPSVSREHQIEIGPEVTDIAAMLVLVRLDVLAERPEVAAALKPAAPSDVSWSP